MVWFVFILLIFIFVLNMHRGLERLQVEAVQFPPFM